MSDSNFNLDFLAIPTEYILNPDLKWVEKALLSEVLFFSKNGQCFASNEYFAQFLNLTADRVKHIIPDLVKRGYLNSETKYNPEKRKKERILTLTDQSAISNTTHSAIFNTNQSAKNDTIIYKYEYNSIEYNNTIQSNPSTKVEHSREGFNNLSSITSNTNSSTLSESADALFEDGEEVNFSNIPMLEMAVLESCRKNNISRSQDAIDTISDFFVRFANTYKEKSNRSLETIAFDKLNKHIRTLISFKTKNGNRMSILDYKPEDIQWMIDDYFDYDFGERCTYSINHFMSKSVLSARFWRIENRLNRIAG